MKKTAQEAYYKFAVQMQQAFADVLEMKTESAGAEIDGAGFFVIIQDVALVQVRMNETEREIPFRHFLERLPDN